MAIAKIWGQLWAHKIDRSGFGYNSHAERESGREVLAVIRQMVDGGRRAEVEMRTDGTTFIRVNHDDGKSSSLLDTIILSDGKAGNGETDKKIRALLHAAKNTLICLDEAVSFATETSPGGVHNAGMWHSARHELNDVIAAFPEYAEG